jgi:hypothetical protein
MKPVWEPAQLAIAAIVIGLAAVAVLLLTTRQFGWRLAGPLAVLALTPLVPNVHVALGFSFDDIPALVGLAGLVLVLVPFDDAPALAVGRRLLLALAVGVGLLLVAGLVSSLFVAESPLAFLRMAMRSSGRLALLAAIAVGVAFAVSRRERGSEFVATAIATVGTFEAAFGILAFVVPLPGDIGLGSEKGPRSALFGEVPGRVTGTLGVGANFLGAVLMVSLLLTVGLAIDARSTRARMAWMACGVIQIIGLTLTFSRAPIGLAAVGILAVVLFARRPVLALPLIGAGVLVTLLTPLGERFLNDASNRLALWYAAVLLMIDHPLTGVGSGQMVATMREWPERYIDTPLGRAGASAHNSVLLAGAEHGVLGAIGALLLHGTIVALALFVLFRGRKDGRRSAVELAGVVAILAFEGQAVVNNLFTVGVTSVMAAILVGAFLLARRPGEPTVAAAASG